MDNKYLIKTNDFSKKNCQKLEILYLVMNSPELLSNQIYTLLAQKIITDDYIHNLENFLSYNLNKVEGNDTAIDKYIKHVNIKFEEMFASFNIKDKILTESAVSSAARIMSTLGQYTEKNVNLACGTHDNKCKYLLKIIYSHITYYNLKKDLYEKITDVVENFKTIKKCEKRLLHYNTLKNTISFLENIIKSELIYITRGEINDNKIDSLIENATKSDKEQFKKLNLKRENREQILQYSMIIATVSTGTALTLGLTGVGAIGVPIATTAATLAGIASNIANVSRYRISKDIEKIKKI